MTTKATNFALRWVSSRNKHNSIVFTGYYPWRPRSNRQVALTNDEICILEEPKTDDNLESQTLLFRHHRQAVSTNCFLFNERMSSWTCPLKPEFSGLLNSTCFYYCRYQVSGLVWSISTHWSMSKQAYTRNSLPMIWRTVGLSCFGILLKGFTVFYYVDVIKVEGI